MLEEGAWGEKQEGKSGQSIKQEATMGDAAVASAGGGAAASFQLPVDGEEAGFCSWLRALVFPLTEALCEVCGLENCGCTKSVDAQKCGWCGI